MLDQVSLWNCSSALATLAGFRTASNLRERASRSCRVFYDLFSEVTHVMVRKEELSVLNRPEASLNSSFSDDSDIPRTGGTWLNTSLSKG